MPGRCGGGGTVGFAEEVHNAGARPEGSVVIACAVAVGTPGAVAGHRDEDKIRTMRLQLFVSKAVALTALRQEVGDEDVGLAYKPVDDLAGGWPIEIECDSPLAAIVELEERVEGEFPIGAGAPVRAVGLAAGRLDLDDIRARIGEECTAGRRRKPIRYLQDPDACERALCRRSGHAPLTA